MKKYLSLVGSPYLGMLLVIALWGGNFVAMKLGVAYVPPFTVAFVRSIAMAVMLFGFYYCCKIPLPKLSPKDLFVLAVLGFTGVFLFSIFLYTGMKLTTVTESSLIYTTAPIFTALIAAVFLDEPLVPRQVAGIVISCFGVSWLVTGGELDKLTGINFNMGNLLILAASITWAVFTVISKAMVERFSALFITAATFLFGGIFSLPPAIVEAYQGLLPAPTLQVIIPMLYIILACFGMIGWNKCITRVGVDQTAAFLNLQPVFSMFFAVLILGEQILSQHLVGAVLVSLGLYLTASVGADKSKYPGETDNGPKTGVKE